MEKRVLEITKSLAEYVTLVSRRNMRVHLDSTTNKKDDKEVEQKYGLRVGQITELNAISNNLLGENIYDGRFDREEVETFLLQILNEIFDNKKL